MNIRIKVGNRETSQDPTFSFRFEGHDSFVLLRSEIEEYLAQPGRQWMRPYMDLSRIVILSHTMIDVLKTDRIYNLAGRMVGLDAKGTTIGVDVHKLFKRALHVGTITPAGKWGDVEFEFEHARFDVPNGDGPKITPIMQLVNRVAVQHGQDVDTVRWHRQRFIESLLSFRSLTRENWRKLMQTLSHYAENGKLFGGGIGEINFRAFGMYGGIICRDTEFSVHT